MRPVAPVRVHCRRGNPHLTLSLTVAPRFPIAQYSIALALALALALTLAFG